MIGLAAPVLLLTMAADGGVVTPAPCPDLAACLDAVEQRRTTSRGIDKREQAVAVAIRRHGRAALPRLLKLLGSPRREVRALAGYTLRELDGLTEAEVPPLVRALAEGEQWVALALARIGSPAAIEGLYASLVANPQTETQVTWAFQKLAARGVPRLLAAFDCSGDCDQPLLNAVVTIFRELGGEGATAIPRLLTVVRDAGRPVRARVAAVRALGMIGPAAAPAVPSLQQLAASEADLFAAPVERALIAMKVPTGAEALAASLARSPSRALLRELAQVGPAGKLAVPMAVKLLDHDDWELRVAAARALGYLGDRAAIAPLRARLASAENWQLVHVAAESLGRLGDPSVLPALEEVARGHWYPPVRQSASKAREVIAGRAAYDARRARMFGVEFSSYERAGQDVPRCRPASEKGPFDPGPVLPVDDGALVGTDRGEFGGTLLHRDRQGREQTIHAHNVQAIARVGGRILALTGLAHLLSNRGVVLEVIRDRSGSWSARPFRVLPGAAQAAAVGGDGRWLIHSTGGSVVLAPDGTMSMATCAP